MKEIVRLATAMDKKIDDVDDKKVAKTDIDIVVATDATVVGTGDNKYVRTAKRNLKSGTTSQSDSQIPLADATNAGLMSKGDFSALEKVVDDVAALKGSIKTIYIDLTGAVDPANPTQQELQDAYETETSTMGEANDGAIIQDTVSGLKWKWSTTKQEWILDSAAPIANFSKGSPGLIVGCESTDEGQVFAENDGKGSVIGWAGLVGRVANVESDVQALDDDLDAVEQELSDVKDDVADLNTDVASLKVQVFDKNTPLLGTVADYSDLITKLTNEGYYV